MKPSVHILYFFRLNLCELQIAIALYCIVYAHLPLILLSIYVYWYV